MDNSYKVTPVKKRTAQRYMQVAEYSAKLSSSRNLQEAYKLIESEESKKKQAEPNKT